MLCKFVTVHVNTGHVKMDYLFKLYVIIDYSSSVSEYGVLLLNRIYRALYSQINVL